LWRASWDWASEEGSQLNGAACETPASAAEVAGVTAGDMDPVPAAEVAGVTAGDMDPVPAAESLRPKPGVPDWAAVVAVRSPRTRMLARRDALNGIRGWEVRDRRWDHYRHLMKYRDG
jgi:hypothetical protein